MAQLAVAAQHEPERGACEGVRRLLPSGDLLLRLPDKALGEVVEGPVVEEALRLRIRYVLGLLQHGVDRVGDARNLGLRVGQLSNLGRDGALRSKALLPPCRIRRDCRQDFLLDRAHLGLPVRILLRGDRPDALASAHRIVHALFLGELGELLFLGGRTRLFLFGCALLALDAREFGLARALCLGLGLLLALACVGELLGLVCRALFGVADRLLDALPKRRVALVERLALDALRFLLLQLEARKQVRHLLDAAVCGARRRGVPHTHGALVKDGPLGQ